MIRNGYGEGEDRLSGVLRELAQHERAISAPPEVGQSLHHASREWISGQRRLRARQRVVMLATAASLLLVVGVIGIGVRVALRRSPETLISQVPSQMPPQVIGSVAGSTVLNDESRLPTVSMSRAVFRGTQIGQERTGDDVAAVLWLRASDNGEAGSFEYTVTTRLSAASLRQWGLTGIVPDEEARRNSVSSLSEGTGGAIVEVMGGDMVDAEIVYGENGMARAIRVLR